MKKTLGMRRLTKASAAGLTVLLITAGCGSATLPQPLSSQTAKETPNIDAKRFDVVTARIQDTLAKADSVRDANQLKETFTSLAFQQRSAEYNLINGNSAPDSKPVDLTRLTFKPQVSTVSVGNSFPRLVMSVSEVPQGGMLPAFEVFKQDNVRENFKLAAYAELFPGAQVPSLKALSVGTQTAEKNNKLLVAANQVLSKYAGSLSSPEGNTSASNSADRKLFIDDPFRASITKLGEDMKKAVGAVGTTAFTHTAPTDNREIYTLNTAEGGAIVVGMLTSDIKVKLTQKGAKISLGGQIGGLLQSFTGSKDIPGEADAIYLTTLVFYIPPDGGSAKQVSVLGATSVLGMVTKNDAAKPAG